MHTKLYIYLFLVIPVVLKTNNIYLTDMSSLLANAAAAQMGGGMGGMGAMGGGMGGT